MLQISFKVRDSERNDMKTIYDLIITLPWTRCGRLRDRYGPFTQWIITPDQRLRAYEDCNSLSIISCPGITARKIQFGVNTATDTSTIRLLLLI